MTHTKGPWEHGKYGPLSFAEMRSKYAQSLKATLDHFGGEFLNEVHGVYVAGTEIRICETGISPNSPANARLIAAAPDLLDVAKQIIAWALKHDRGNEGSELLEILSETQAAITKAEGRSA